MALTERFENDKIEVVGQYKAVQVRRATVIERDGVEINRSFHRHVLQPGTVAEGTSTLTDTDISIYQIVIIVQCSTLKRIAMESARNLHSISFNNSCSTNLNCFVLTNDFDLVVFKSFSKCH